MRGTIIFVGFAISWGLLAHGHASTGYFVGLVFSTFIAVLAASTGIIFAAFAISWGLLAHGHASDGYFVGLVIATIVSSLATS